MRKWIALAAVVALCPFLIQPVWAAFVDTDSNNGNYFAAGGGFLSSTDEVLADGPLHFFRGEEAESATAGSTATDSSGGNRNGVYQPRTDSPATHWMLNEALGTAVYERGGGSTSGVLGSTAVLNSVGKITGSVTLNGTANSYIAGNRWAVRTDTSLSVAAWVKLTTTTAGSVVSQVGTAASGFDLQYSATSGGRWQFRMTDGNSASATDDIAYSAAAASAATWYHVVGVYNASLASNQMTLYVNGTAQAATATHSTAWNATGGLQVGRSMVGGAWTTNYLNGLVDDVRVYPRALTAAEVTTIYNGGNGSESALAQGLAARVPGALVASPTSTYAMGFSGKLGSTNGYTLASYSTSFPCTVETWFRASSMVSGFGNPGGLMIGFAQAQTGDAVAMDRDRMLFLSTAGHVGFGVNSGGYQTLLSPNTYWDGAWHYAAASIGAAGIKLYVDDALVDSDPSITSGWAINGYWRWGGMRGSGYAEYDTVSGYFTGALDEVAIYGTQLSNARIAAHYAANS